MPVDAAAAAAEEAGEVSSPIFNDLIWRWKERERIINFVLHSQRQKKGGGGSSIARLGGGGGCGWLLPIQRIMIVRGIVVGRYDTLSRCVLCVA